MSDWARCVFEDVEKTRRITLDLGVAEDGFLLRSAKFYGMVQYIHEKEDYPFVLTPEPQKENGGNVDYGYGYASKPRFGTMPLYRTKIAIGAHVLFSDDTTNPVPVELVELLPLQDI